MTSEGPYESGYPHGSEGYPPESDPAGQPPRHRHTADDVPPPGMPGARAAVRMPDDLRADPPPSGPPGAAGGGQVYGRPSAPSTYGGPAQPAVDDPPYGGQSAQPGVYGGQSAQPGVYGGQSAQPGGYGGQSSQSSPPAPPGVYGAPQGGVYGGAPPPPAPQQPGVYGSQAGVYGSSAQPGGSVSGGSVSGGSVSGPGPSASSAGPAVYGAPRVGGPGPAYAAPDDVPPPRPAVSPMPPAEPAGTRVYGRPPGPETEVAGPGVPHQRAGGPAWVDAPHPGDAMGGTVVDANLAAARQAGVYGRPGGAAPAGYPEPAAPAAAPAWQPPPGNAPVGQPVYGGGPAAYEPVPPPPARGKGLRKVGYIGVAVLVVGAGVLALYYTSRPNPPSYDVGTCVQQAGDKAESAACGAVGSYQVVSRVADRASCPDPAQPIIQLSSGDAATRVVCLKPAR